jgi:hypothetical protein
VRFEFARGQDGDGVGVRMRALLRRVVGVFDDFVLHTAGMSRGCCGGWMDEQDAGACRGDGGAAETCGTAGARWLGGRKLGEPAA